MPRQRRALRIEEDGPRFPDRVLAPLLVGCPATERRPVCDERQEPFLIPIGHRLIEVLVRFHDLRLRCLDVRLLRRQPHATGNQTENHAPDASHRMLSPRSRFAGTRHSVAEIPPAAPKPRQRRRRALPALPADPAQSGRRRPNPSYNRSVAHPERTPRGSAAAGAPPKTPKKAFTAGAWEEARTLIWAHRKRMALGLGLMIINRLSGLVLPTTTKYLMDDVISQGHWELLPTLAMAAGTATLVDAGTAFANSQVLGVAAQRAITEMRKDIEAHVMRLPIRYFDSTKSGILISRIMTDAEGIRNLVGTGLVQLTG